MTTQPTLTPSAFAANWRGVTTTEKAAAQEHFIDLCRLLGEPTPHEADPIGSQYAFEKRVVKAGGGDGCADDPYDKLRRALRADISDEAWATVNSTVSRPFPRPKTGKVAVKVINHYGDEVMKVFTV